MAEEKILEGGGGVFIPEEDEVTREVAIDFGGFIVGLYQTALINLGRLEGAEHGMDVDFDAARQTIELLRLLKDKTQGNLDAEEVKLMQSLLHELRVAYIDATK